VPAKKANAEDGLRKLTRGARKSKNRHKLRGGGFERPLKIGGRLFGQEFRGRKKEGLSGKEH